MKHFASAIVVAIVAMMATVTATGTVSAECLAGTYTNDGAALDGAAYTIKIPNNFNGQLVVYARHFELSKPATADAFWHGLPAFLGGTGFTQTQDFEGPLLALGYALAGSTLRDGGWVVAEGLQDLTRLVTTFRTNHCTPTRTIIVGFDMGGLIALKSMEANRRTFDGAVAACAPAAGMTRHIDRGLRQNLAIAASLEWPATWGTPGDIRDDLTQAEVDAVHYLGSNASERLFVAFDFIRFLLKVEPVSIYFDPPAPARVTLVRYFTLVLAAIERRYGGPVAQNVGQTPYALTQDELNVLDFIFEFEDQFGFAPCDPADGALCPLALRSGAQLLAALNALPPVVADPTARARLAATNDFTGLITGPVLLVHTTVDPIFPEEGTTAYVNAVTARGRQAQVLRVFTQSRAGHCEFSPKHLTGAVLAMSAWLQAGVPPVPHDENLFPTRDGFAHGFTPGPWPF